MSLLQRVKRLAGFAPLPTGIDLFLTDDCNLRCSYCPSSVDTKVRRGPLLDTQRAILFLESVAHFRPMIRMIGGEPFLHPEWPKIFAAAAANSLPFTVVTNGTKLVGRAEELVESGLAAVGISVDPPEEHDRRRGKGTFETCRKVIEEIVTAREKLGSSAPLIEIYTTVHEGTYSLLTNWAKRLAEWRIDTLRLQHKIWLRSAQRPASKDLLQRAIGDATFFHSEIDSYCTDVMPDIDGDLLAEQLRCLEAMKHPFQVDLHPPLPIEEMVDFYRNPDFHRKTARQCTLTSTYTFVDPSGRLFPCLTLDMGNVFERPFEEVWNGSKFRAFRRLLRRHGRLPCCEHCPS